MSLKLGNTDINKLYLGGQDIGKAYLGSTLVYEEGGGAVVPDGLFAYYRLEDDISDSANSWNGLLEGGVYDVGLHGRGVRGSFLSDVPFSVPANDIFRIVQSDNSSNPMSRTLWVNWNNLASSVYVFNVQGSVARDYYMYFSGTELRWRISGDTLTNANYIGVKIPAFKDGLVNGTWYHLGFTYDGSGLNSGMKVYVNGVEQTVTGANSGTYTPTYDATARTNVGGFTISSNAIFATVDGVGFWNKELNATEMLDVYNQQVLGELV